MRKVSEFDRIVPCFSVHFQLWTELKSHFTEKNYPDLNLRNIEQCFLGPI